MRVILINKKLVGKLTDGTPLMMDCTDEQVAYLNENILTLTEEWIKEQFFPEKEKKEAVIQALSGLEAHTDFRLENGCYYYKDIDLSIPELLVKEFTNCIDNKERFSALVNFWKLCCLNPNPQARQDLFKFLSQGKFTITPKGLFVAYRNVAIKKEGDNKKLEEFVKANIIKVKSWKKSPKNYTVTRNKDGNFNLVDTKKTELSLIDDPMEGTLQELSEIESNTIYTDNHTRTFSIKIGTPVSMDRADCDHNAGRDCSSGLHLSGKGYLTQNAFGQVGLVCLCNPYHVVSVPHYNTNKLRCCEYLPIGIAEYDKDGELIEIDTDLYEDDYCQFTTFKINVMLSDANLEEHQINSLFEDAVNSDVIRKMAVKALETKNVYLGQ